MRHLAWQSNWDNFGDDVLLTHCNRAVGSLDLWNDSVVFEAALSDCEACLHARSLALNRARPGSCAAKSGTLTNPHDAGTCVMPSGHKGDHIGQGLAWANTPPGRGERALVLLKELLRLKHQPSSTGEYSEYLNYHEATVETWAKVRELLAEEVPGTEVAP